MNLNPIASGNKTNSGLIGIVATCAIAYGLKKLNIEDKDGTITIMIFAGIPTAVLTIVGIGHKIVKAGGIKKLCIDMKKKFWG